LTLPRYGYSAVPLPPSYLAWADTPKKHITIKIDKKRTFLRFVISPIYFLLKILIISPIQALLSLAKIMVIQEKG
jgi:hypothetical protein